MIAHDSWWSNGNAHLTIIDYHDLFDQGLSFPFARAFSLSLYKGCRQLLSENTYLVCTIAAYCYESKYSRRVKMCSDTAH